MDEDILLADIKRLRQILFWLCIAAGLTAPAYLITALLFALPAMLLHAGMSAGALVGFIGAFWFVRQGYVRRGVYLIAGVLAFSTLVAGLATPHLLPLLILMPILSMAVMLPYLDQQMLRVLSTGIMLIVIVLIFTTQFVSPFAPLPIFISDIILISLTPVTTAIILLLFSQTYTRQKTALQQSRQANTSLQSLQASLETQVAARTSELRSALGSLGEQAAEQKRMREALEHEREVVRELSVPVLPVTAETLVMPLIGALDTRRLHDLQQRALSGLEQSRARRLILDITGVPIVDSHVAQGLIRVVQAARLLGTTVILVGIRPEVAQSLVGLGIDLGHIQTFASLQSALSNSK